MTSTLCVDQARCVFRAGLARRYSRCLRRGRRAPRWRRLSRRLDRRRPASLCPSRRRMDRIVARESRASRVAPRLGVWRVSKSVCCGSKTAWSTTKKKQLLTRPHPPNARASHGGVGIGRHVCPLVHGGLVIEAVADRRIVRHSAPNDHLGSGPRRDRAASSEVRFFEVQPCGCYEVVKFARAECFVVTG